ncbi:MAG TPA: hypothetical protein VH280_13210 [Verrucomicrobiae bacterium]|nr:hypothetical protein [Verrucomicrobiae bacterium]
MNNPAWLLAAVSNLRMWDGKTAMALATRACEITGFMGTHAAACAEADRFDDAITNAQRPRAVALSLGQAQIAARDEQLLELYQAGKPFHEAGDVN